MVDPLIAVVAVGCALGVFAWVGLRVRMADGGVEEYVVARGSQRAGALGLSFLASGMGAWILFATPEVGAFVGLVAVVGYALGAAAPILAFAFLGPRLRAVVPTGHSLTEFVRLRYGRIFHGYVVAISVGYMAFFVTAELTAVGAVTAILSGADPRLAVLAVAVITLAYTTYGGLRASIRTDSWQAWLLLALLGVAGVAILVALPSPGAALSGSGLLGLDRAGAEAAVALLLAVTAANMFHQGYWQRVWAARDGGALSRGALLGAALTVPVVLVVGLLGIVAAGAGVALGDPPAPFFALLAGLPAWVAVVVLVLGVSLVASSVDTLENGLASVVAVERPALSLRGARLATVAVMVPAVIVALQGYSVLRLFLTADLLCATAVVPALLGLWRRATPTAALAGGIAGLVGACTPGVLATGELVEGLRLATFPAGVPTLWPFVGAVLASTAVTVAVSLAGRSDVDLASLRARVPHLGEAR